MTDSRHKEPKTVRMDTSPESPAGSATGQPVDFDNPSPEYVDIEPYREGGMAVIFKAYQPSLRRHVALKRLRPELAGDARCQKTFASEAFVTGLLEHPNIVPVHKLEQAADGEASLAMKFVTGTTWRSLLDPESPEEEKLAALYNEERHFEVLLKVCDAVAYAHSRSILHLDLTPSNVMVGEFGEVLLMDWGIAISAADSPEESAGKLTRVDIDRPIGTPAFMAPEMAEANAESVGPCTDVFQLGGLLYFLLNRRPLYSGNTTERVLIAAVSCEPPPFDPQVASEIRDICLKAIAPNPGDRYASVGDLSGALRDYLEHRQSWKIARDATRRMEECEEIYRKSDKAFEAKDLYDTFAFIDAAYRQALVLWPDNREAAAKRKHGLLLYAQIAYDAGDYQLVKAILKGLSGDEAENLRIKSDRADSKRLQVRTTIRRLKNTMGIGFAIALALATSMVFVFHSMESAGFEIGSQMRVELTEEGLRSMRAFVRDTAHMILQNIEKIEIALESYASAVENQVTMSSLGSIRLNPRDVLWSKDIDQGRYGGRTFGEDPAYRRLGVAGDEVANPITWDAQAFSLAPETKRSAVRRDVAILEQAWPVIRNLRTTGGSSAARYFVGLENGLFAVYPGSGNLGKYFDPRLRPWYADGRKAQAMVKTPPYTSASTRTVVITFARALRRSDGTAYGVAGIDATIDSILKASPMPAQWSDRAFIKLVRVVGDSAGSRRLEVFAERDYEKQQPQSTWRYDVDLKEISKPDSEAFTSILVDMRAAKTGLSQLTYKGKPSLWGYAPVDEHGTNLLVIVPTATIVAKAVEIDRDVRQRMLTELRALGVWVMILLAGSLLLWGAATRIRRE